MAFLGEFGEERFHFGAGVGVTFAGGDGDAGIEHGAGLFGAGLFGEELGIHEIAGDIFDVALKQFSEMYISVRGIAGIGTFEGEAVTGEGVIGFFGDKLFEQLATCFLWFGHRGFVL